MHSLVRHPDTPAGAVHLVEASLERTDYGAVACFVAHGPTERLNLPAAVKPRRSDDLWRTTCFELFIGGSGDSYREFNLSPSGAWAAYQFDNYRQGMRAADADVLIKIDRHSSRLALVADIRCEIPDRAPIGLTAVVDETDGIIRYWAESFAPGKPDFHAPAVRSLILDEVDAG